MDEQQRQWAAPEGWGPPSSPQSSPPSYGAPSGAAPSGAGPEAPPYGTPYGGPPTHGGWGGPRHLKPGVVPLRPLGLGEILDGAVGILRRYPKPTLGLSALVALVSTVLNIAISLLAFNPLASFDTTGTVGADEAGEIAGAVAGGGLSAVVGLLSGVVLSGVITVVVGKAVLGQKLTLSEAWGAARPHLLKLVGLALLVGLLVALAGLVLIGVGVGLPAAGGAPLLLIGIPLVLAGIAASAYLYVRWALAPCALVLERLGVRRSMSRSSVLAKGDWWRLFGILLLTGLIAFVTALVLQIPFQVAGAAILFTGGSETGTLPVVLSSIGGGLAMLLTAPFSAAVAALLYVDRRMRAEGLDVALTAAATSGEPAGGL